ncbi:MAG TPA: AAA family ATPase [Kribbellaceae bacterium]|nr:AAA family ATPase [Kribbellaceae bacterium]
MNAALALALQYVADGWSQTDAAERTGVPLYELRAAIEAYAPETVADLPPATSVAPARGHRPSAGVSDVTPGLLAGLRNGVWLDAQTFPPLRYAVPGLFPEGFGLHIGPPKIGKSWALQDVALAVASGGLAFGAVHTGVPRSVLLLALEDGDRRLQDRARRLLGTCPIPARFNYLTRVQPGAAVDTIEAWLEQTDDAALVIVDTLGRVMPPALPGESAYQRDYRVGARLKRIADDRPGLCLLVNHHDRKASSDDFVDSVSGTHGLAGAADTIAVLSRPRQETEGSLKVTGRDVPEAEYALNFVDGCAWQLYGGDLVKSAERAATVAASAGLADRTVDIVSFVARHPGGVRARDVEVEFGADARRYLARLADSGRLTRAARGLYTVSPQSQRPNLTLISGQRDSGDAPSEEPS